MLVKNNSHDADAFRGILQPYIPENSLDYAVNLWIEQPFSFKISRTRRSCLGNYQYRNKQHYITVNNDLNPYQFLLTYVHEVAHQRTFTQSLASGILLPPHGQEWKENFRQLMMPLLHPLVFPPDLLPLALKHMKSPSSSTHRDMKLTKALKKYNLLADPEQPVIHLSDISIGKTFTFRGRAFVKKEERRTRGLCLCVKTKKLYTLSLIAVVEKVDS